MVYLNIIVLVHIVKDVFVYGCLTGTVVTRSPLTAVTRVQYPALACEMIMWSQSQTGGFPPGTPVSSHTKTTGTQTSVPTSMLNISCITCFVHTKHV